MKSDQKLNSIILSTILGPVFPIYKIIERDGQLQCECRKGLNCKTPGKHPRWSGWKDSGWKNSPTTHVGLIQLWHRQYPNANWGAILGIDTFALDCDVRPFAEPPKDGLSEIIRLNGGTRPETIEIVSGGGGSHFYFTLPVRGFDLEDLEAPYGIDLKRNGFCVLPGSRHISGNYYRFAEPKYRLSEAPNELLGVLRSPKIKESIVEPPRPQHMDSTERTKSQIWNLERPENAVPQGNPQTDFEIIAPLKRNPHAAARYFDGFMTSTPPDGKPDRSREDFALCCTLAHYCNHHWEQYIRLFQQSALFGNKSRPDYIGRTLKNAFVRQTRNSDETKKRRRKKAPSQGKDSGIDCVSLPRTDYTYVQLYPSPSKTQRPLSPKTVAVRELKEREPALSSAEIASILKINHATVRTILSRWKLDKITMNEKLIHELENQLQNARRMEDIETRESVLVCD